MVVTQATRRGFWIGPLITLGHAIAELAIVAALAFGLRDLLAASRIPMIIALGGGLFLLWMGASTLRDALTRDPILAPAMASQAPQDRLGPAWAGFATTFSNPYWFLWWSTVGASYVVLSLGHGAPGVLAFYSGHILADLSWNSLLSFLIASGRRWLPPQLLRAFLAAAAIFLVGLGVFFMISGVRMLAQG